MSSGLSEGGRTDELDKGSSKADSPVLERRNRSGIISAPLNKSLKNSRTLSQYTAVSSATTNGHKDNSESKPKAPPPAPPQPTVSALTAGKLDRTLEQVLEGQNGLLHFAQAAALLKRAGMEHMLLPGGMGVGVGDAGSGASDLEGTGWFPLQPGAVHHDAVPSSDSCRNRKTGHQICKFRKCEELKKKPSAALEVRGPDFEFESS
uniref:Uncharacterized protein n=1 Tax=Neogobius melanostomus TaxID=47308 RepID=A0A8C6WIW1_9GOBI